VSRGPSLGANTATAQHSRGFLSVVSQAGSSHSLRAAGQARRAPACMYHRNFPLSVAVERLNGHVPPVCCLGAQRLRMAPPALPLSAQHPTTATWDRFRFRFVVCFSSPPLAARPRSAVTSLPFLSVLTAHAARENFSLAGAARIAAPPFPLPWIFYHHPLALRTNRIPCLAWLGWHASSLLATHPLLAKAARSDRRNPSLRSPSFHLSRTHSRTHFYSSSR